MWKSVIFFLLNSQTLFQASNLQPVQQPVDYKMRESQSATVRHYLVENVVI